RHASGAGRPHMLALLWLSEFGAAGDHSAAAPSGTRLLSLLLQHYIAAPVGLSGAPSCSPRIRRPRGLRVSRDTTTLLQAVRAGDRDAFDALFALAYEDLRRAAHHRLARHRPGETLN